MENIRKFRHYMFDSTNDKRFYEYYANESLLPQTVDRFRRIREVILSFVEPSRAGQLLKVADIGCGAGTQCFLWADQGHCAYGIDVSEQLITLARSRALRRNTKAFFMLGSASNLPLDDSSVDVCIMPELLEHVSDWKGCLNEAARVLDMGGVLFLTTTNMLCPRQQEFNLPAYSWYPRCVKRRYEHLARTARPMLANYATYPAVNWFSFYSLRSALSRLGFESFDRFDVLARTSSGTKRSIANVIRHVPSLRFLGHVATPHTQVLSIKHHRIERDPISAAESVRCAG